MFDKIVSESCVALFRGFGVNAAPSSSAELSEADPTALTAAVVTFGGTDVRGTLVLATSFEVVASCVPKDPAVAFSKGSPQAWMVVRDCTKELANQLLGRIKNRLRFEGLTFEARTPTVVTGHAAASMINSRAAAPQRFTAASKPVAVWFEAVASPDAKRASGEFPVKSMLEGDVVLSPSEPRVAPGGSGPKKVLVIDDSLIARQQVGTPLRQAGYEVSEAASGMEGLRQIESGDPIGVVICDVNMPVLDGLALLETVAAKGVLSRIPFLMLTSEAQPETVARARALGVRGWMVKPVKADTLVGAVRKLVG